MNTQITVGEYEHIFVGEENDTRNGAIDGKTFSELESFVLQNSETGEIEVTGDYRSAFSDENFENNLIIDFTFYYPYSFESPYAAYLLPKDIEIGERVFLEDLIEDYIGKTWNQGDTYRLESCEAIWDGKLFDVLYDNTTVCHAIG